MSCFKTDDFINRHLLSTIQLYASDHQVPIIHDQGFEVLSHLIQSKGIKHILEIGSAIGYSAIGMALLSPDIHIDSIERRTDWHQKAIEFNIEYQTTHQIRFFLDDALSIDLEQLNHDYDLIFIDAAKAQYRKFFERFSPLLVKGGFIVCDNIHFHGLVTSNQPIVSRHVRALVKKIREYNQWLSKHEGYKTQFLDVGDGITISEKL